METININAIPENVEIIGMKINLRKRFINFMEGKGKPAEKDNYFLVDVIDWIAWEGIPELRNLIKEK